MRRGRKILLAVLVVLLALALLVGGVMYSAFAGLAPIRDGQGPTPGVRTVKLGFVSAFVLDAGPGAVALVDTGADAGGADLLRALGASGRSAAEVRAVFLTHGHGDHTAATARFPHATVYAMAAERELIAGRAKPRSPIGFLSRARPTGIEVTHPLSDGESVQVGALTVRAFAVPGHTPGSAAYLAHEALFLGDAASGTAAGTVRGPVWAFSESTAQGRDSLRALAARLSREGAPVRALAFAHSGPLTGPGVLARLAAVQ